MQILRRLKRWHCLNVELLVTTQEGSRRLKVAGNRGFNALAMGDIVTHLHGFSAETMKFGELGLGA